MLQQIWDSLSPYLMDLLATGLVALLAWIGVSVKARIGLDIEASLRDALHKAMLSGAQSASGKGLSGTAATDATLAYAQASVPGAIKSLNPTLNVLTNLAKAKLEEVFISKLGRKP